MKSLLSLLIILAISFLSSTSVFANPSEWLSCNTSGDALSGVYLSLNEVDAKTTQILAQVTMSSGDVKSYTTDITKTSFASMEKFGRYEFFLKGPSASSFGGAISNSGLLTMRVLTIKGEKVYKAKFAANSFVYILTCKLPKGYSSF
jgi:hypothetical protein